MRPAACGLYLYIFAQLKKQSFGTMCICVFIIPKCRKKKKAYLDSYIFIRRTSYFCVLDGPQPIWKVWVISTLRAKKFRMRICLTSRKRKKCALSCFAFLIIIKCVCLFVVVAILHNNPTNCDELPSLTRRMTHSFQSSLRPSAIETFLQLSFVYADVSAISIWRLKRKKIITNAWDINKKLGEKSTSQFDECHFDFKWNFRSKFFLSLALIHLMEKNRRRKAVHINFFRFVNAIYTICISSFFLRKNENT